MKAALKAVADAVALVLVTPALLLYALASVVAGKERAFPGWSQFFSLIPGTVGVYLRRAFYRVVLKRCGSGS